MAKYNGRMNWNRWNVSIWINGDEAIYHTAVSLCRRYGKDQAARILASELPAKTPDGARYSVTAIRAALVGM